MTTTRLLLAGDVGGTKTHLGLFEADSLTPVEIKTFASADFTDLPAMLRAFFGDRDPRCHAACISAAGPVLDGVCHITNLSWAIRVDELRQTLHCPAFVINDLEANGNGIALLPQSDFHPIQAGEPRVGNAALISAGTGLGECILFWDGMRHIPIPSEGGHASFAPSDLTEAALLAYLWETYEHVSWERLVSGTFGFEHLYRFLRDTGRAAGSAELEAFAAAHGYGAAVAKFADEGLPIAVAVMERFVSLYGSEAGNLALKALAVGGVFIGGGIAPKILKWMTAGGFLRAFIAKGRFRRFLERIPVAVILNTQTALLGAAQYAKHHAP
ncbi:MAG: glucokinase [Chloracidobacterium sp.]|nr:glucokinase [Chloracidobacterium sp.]MDW8216978.1 glucokinase [Acidobacteriota bacterium]